MNQQKPINAMSFREIADKTERLLVENLLESAFGPMKDRAAAERFIKISSDVEKLWVLEIEGSISGTLSVNPVKEKKGVWFINNFCVAPYWRRGGLAKFMLSKCFEYLDERDCKAVVVMLHPELVAAEKLFLGELEFTAIREEGSTGVYLATLK